MADPKTVFFDVADTLVHMPELYPTVTAALTQLGFHVPVEKVRIVHKSLRIAHVLPDRPDADFYANLNRMWALALGIPPTQEVLAAIASACSAQTWVPTTTAERISALAADAYVLSNWDTSLHTKIANWFGQKVFAGIFGSADLQIAKPDPEFFKRAAHLAGAEPEHCWMIGDSLHLDCMPAWQLGWNTVLVDQDAPDFQIDRMYRAASIEDAMHTIGTVQ